MNCSGPMRPTRLPYCAGSHESEGGAGAGEEDEAKAEAEADEDEAGGGGGAAVGAAMGKLVFACYASKISHGDQSGGGKGRDIYLEQKRAVSIARAMPVERRQAHGLDAALSGPQMRLQLRRRVFRQ